MLPGNVSGDEPLDHPHKKVYACIYFKTTTSLNARISEASGAWETSHVSQAARRGSIFAAVRHFPCSTASANSDIITMMGRERPDLRPRGVPTPSHA